VSKKTESKIHFAKIGLLETPLSSFRLLVSLRATAHAQHQQGRSGLALGALAYWLYTQSRKTEVLSQQGQQVLKQAEVAINNTNQSQFPTKGQMIAAFQQYRPSDVNHLNSYNEKDGTFSNGNWRMSVVSSNPIRVKAAKGGEVFYIDTQYFVSKNQGVKGLKGWKGIGLRGYAEELRGTSTSYLLR
jgi:hypothetical protein